MTLDETHDPGLARAGSSPRTRPDCRLPDPEPALRRLPKQESEKPRGGVAIGDQILDLAALGMQTGPTLNGLAAMGPAEWQR